MRPTLRKLCVIAARGGSRGVPGKNIRPLGGKPLITWAIHKAWDAGIFDRVVVSTDSPKIAAVAQAAGAAVPFLRPADLANSDAGKFQVWQHALRFCETEFDEKYELFVDVDCTNPLIETRDITCAVDQFQSLRASGKHPDAVFTVAPARRNPYFNLVEPEPDGVLRMSKRQGTTVLARQRAPLVYEHVAGVYVLAPEYLKSAGHLLDGRAFGYEVPPDKAIDIDTELDFEIVQFLLGRKLST